MEFTRAFRLLKLALAVQTFFICNPAWANACKSLFEPLPPWERQIENTNLKLGELLLEKLKIVRQLEQDAQLEKAQKRTAENNREKPLNGFVEGFRILEFLGQGSHATVYKVQTSAEPAALKYHDNFDPADPADSVEDQIAAYKNRAQYVRMVEPVAISDRALLLPYIEGCTVKGILKFGRAAGLSEPELQAISAGFQRFAAAPDGLSVYITDFNTVLNFQTGEFIGIDPF